MDYVDTRYAIRQKARALVVFERKNIVDFITRKNLDLKVKEWLLPYVDVDYYQTMMDCIMMEARLEKLNDYYNLLMLYDVVGDLDGMCSVLGRIRNLTN